MMKNPANAGPQGINPQLGNEQISFNLHVTVFSRDFARMHLNRLLSLTLYQTWEAS